MRHIYRCIFILGIFFSTNAVAQNILTSTIEWNCNSTFISDSGTITGEISKVVSSPTQIIWYDNAGMAKQTLEITGSEGSWTNVANNGSIVFKVNFDNHSGIVTFIKSNDKRLIRIHIVLEGESPIYELTVNDVNSL